jgi:hypothetical protein
VTASCGAVRGLVGEGADEHDKTAVPALHRAGTPPWFVGHASNLCVRRAALLDVGGFDERLGPGVSRYMGEDSDLIWRLLERGATIAAGVGEPVRHLEWRSDAEARDAVVAYEAGAGAYIGKALRAGPRRGAPLLLARLGVLRERWRWERTPEQRRELARAVAALGRGLVVGARLGRAR